MTNEDRRKKSLTAVNAISGVLVVAALLVSAPAQAAGETWQTTTTTTTVSYRSTTTTERVTVTHRALPMHGMRRPAPVAPPRDGWRGPAVDPIWNHDENVVTWGPTVDNVRNGAVVARRVVLLEGSAPGLDGWITIAGPDGSLRYPVIDGRYAAQVPLRPGANDITLRAGNTLTRFVLTYIPPAYDDVRPPPYGGGRW